MSRLKKLYRESWPHPLAARQPGDAAHLPGSVPVQVQGVVVGVMRKY
jgi:hypothetical protein